MAQRKLLFFVSWARHVPPELAQSLASTVRLLHKQQASLVAQRRPHTGGAGSISAAASTHRPRNAATAGRPLIVEEA